MKQLRFSFLLAVTMAGLWLCPVAQAQIVDEQQAERLLETADNVANSSGDIDEITAAYTQALAAFDALDDFESSLSILGALTTLNYAFCRDDQMLMWFEHTLNRMSADDPAARREHLVRYFIWLQDLGEYYEEVGQIERAIALYEAGETYVAEIPEHISITQPLQGLDMLQAQLNLLPPESPAATAAQNRLLALQQHQEIVTEVNESLDDAQLKTTSEPIAITLVKRALTLSQRHGYQVGELRALLMLGKQAIAAENYDQAITYSNQALPLTQQITGADAAPYHEALYILAKAQQGQGQASDAIALYETILAGLLEEPRIYIEARMERVIPDLIELYKATNQLEAAEQLEQTYPGMDYYSILAVHDAQNPEEPETHDAVPRRTVRRIAGHGVLLGFRADCHAENYIPFRPRRREYLIRSPEMQFRLQTPVTPPDSSPVNLEE